MAMGARKLSESSIYHIMLLGVKYQAHFEDDEDENRSLEILRAFIKQCGFELYGYCLMGMMSICGSGKQRGIALFP